MPPAEPEEPGRWCAGIMHCWDARRKQAMMGAMTEITPAAPGMAPAQHPISHGVCGCIADAQQLLPIGLHHPGGGHRTVPAPTIPS